MHITMHVIGAHGVLIFAYQEPILILIY